MTHKKADVMRMVKEQGVKISENADMGRIFADAPAGKVFSGSFVHCLVADFGPKYGPKADAWADLGERLNYGVEDCTVSQGEDPCDYCQENISSI